MTGQGHAGGSGDSPEARGPDPGRPRRVVITSPRLRAHRHQPRRVTREIDEQTSVGEVYVRSLVRTQLRLALLVLAAVGVLLLGLPALFEWLPALSNADVVGIRLPWLVLGVLAFPVLLAVGWLYVRQSERNERDFTDLVESASPAGSGSSADSGSTASGPDHGDHSDGDGGAADEPASGDGPSEHR